MKTLKMLTKAHRQVLITPNLPHTMLLVQVSISQKYMAFFVPITCVRSARYCGKMYGRHLCWYGQFVYEPRLQIHTSRGSFTGTDHSEILEQEPHTIYREMPPEQFFTFTIPFSMKGHTDVSEIVSCDKSP